MKYFLGIDPGLSGALALYCPETEELEVFDMPVHTIRGKNHLDLYALGFLMDSRRAEIKRAVIEEVNAMPKQGVTSSFRFGETFGVAKAMVAANMIPMDLVRPAIWKKSMNLTRDKDASRQRASQMWPQHAKLWPLKKHDGRAEAALIAYYGSR
jgi:crossover junction endodeoxyribonuclease RuvC